MIKAECDRCGAQEIAPGSVVSILGPMGKPRLPELWKRVQIPAEEEQIQGEIKELCPGCVNDLRAFFAGDGAVPGLLSVETLDGRCNCPQPEEPRPPCPVHEQACPDGQHITTEETHPRCVRCGASPFEPEDPRPTLTARAKQIATGNIPVGAATAPCPEGDGRCSGTYTRGQLHEHMKQCHGITVAADSVQCPYCPDIHPGHRLGAHIAQEHPGDWQVWNDGVARG